MVFQKNGYGYITGEIEKGLRDGSRTAGIEGCWEIDREVRIPSGFTLRLSGCHLRMADGCYSNMFVNSGCGTPEGRTPGGACGPRRRRVQRPVGEESSERRTSAGMEEQSSPDCQCRLLQGLGDLLP